MFSMMMPSWFIRLQKSIKSNNVSKNPAIMYVQLATVANNNQYSPYNALGKTIAVSPPSSSTITTISKESGETAKHDEDSSTLNAPPSPGNDFSHVQNIWPKVRTIVCRGFLEENAHQSTTTTHHETKPQYSSLSSPHLTFVTDIWSDKIQDIYSNPNVEICWYFGQTREQYRLSGRMSILVPPQNNFQLKSIVSDSLKQDSGYVNKNDLEQLRVRMWGKLSESAKSGFSGGQPNTPIQKENQNLFVDQNTNIIDKSKDGIDRFCVLIMEVEYVDHLVLGNAQKRFQFVQDKRTRQWTEIEVYP